MLPRLRFPIGSVSANGVAGGVVESLDPPPPRHPGVHEDLTISIQAYRSVIGDDKDSANRNGIPPSHLPAPRARVRARAKRHRGICGDTPCVRDSRARPDSGSFLILESATLEAHSDMILRRDIS